MASNSALVSVVRRSIVDVLSESDEPVRSRELLKRVARQSSVREIMAWHDVGSTTYLQSMVEGVSQLGSRLNFDGGAYSLRD